MRVLNMLFKIRERLLFLLLAMAVVGGSANIAQSQDKTTVYCSVCKHPTLARGVNMFNWFMGPTIYTADHQAQYISAEGLRNLKQAGFTHIRLPVYAKFIADVSQTSAPLIRPRVEALDAAIQTATAQGLTVVLVLNAEDDGYRLATSSSAQTAYGVLWRQLAGRYRGYSTQKIYFEILNEPHFQAFVSDSQARQSWQNLQRTLIAYIRQATRVHYVIVPSYDWDTVSSAVAANPAINDSRAIYTAHFYELIAFSHQGVEDFPDPVVRQLHDMPYPVQKIPCLTALSLLPGDIATQMNWYCNSGFGPATIDQQIKAFMAWAQRRQIPVYLGEFGACRKHAPAGDAEQWIRDVRTSAERYRIPWAYWAYKGDMALSTDGGQPQSSVLQSLLAR